MRRLKVEYLDGALRDLDRIYDYVLEASGFPRRAESYVARVRRACDRLGGSPYSGTSHDELLPGLRTIGFERRATITFRVLPDRLQIVNVLYGGRDIEGFYRRQREDDA